MGTRSGNQRWDIFALKVLDGKTRLSWAIAMFHCPRVYMGTHIVIVILKRKNLEFSKKL